MVTNLTVHQMSFEQQLSFCLFFFKDCLEEWETEDGYDVDIITRALQDRYPEWDNQSLSTSQLLEEKHPGTHMFDGDVYIPLGLDDPYFQEKEEEKVSYVEVELWGLDDARVYPSLERIVFRRKEIDYIGDHDDDYSVVSWVKARMSIQEYKESLLNSLSNLDNI